MDDDTQAGSFWEHPDAKARAVNEATKAMRASTRPDDTASSQPLDDAIAGTSRLVLAWIEAAAATDNERRFFEPELLTSCCKYMEALATAHPARFSAGCQSLATHAAAVLMRAASEGGETEPSRAPVDEDAAESVANGNAETDVGAAPSANGIEQRKALELWVDMFAICLLPFCGGGSTGASRADGRPFQDSADREEADGFYSDTDSDDSDDESGGGDRGGGFAHGKTRSGWVAGWMWRAGMAGAEAPECPFELQAGGRDEGLPLRLAVMIASRAKAAAGASRPASVSSLATALAVICSFTAAAVEEGGGGEGGQPSEGHGKVVEEAFTCLIGLVETVPESSAQAECVKAALVSLKECAEVARLAYLEEYVTSSLSALEGVPSRMKLLLTRSKSEGPKAFSTSRSFCREALAAAVACACTLIGRAGAPIVAEKPRWFLGEFVVKMASPMLLGDAVGALRAAASAVPSDEQLQGPGGEERERKRAGRVLGEVVLPGAVERLAKALGSINRYSGDAAKEVLKAAAWLVSAAQEEVLPHRERLGMALVECASSECRAGGGGGGGIGQNDKVRLCLRAIRLLVAVAATGGEGATAATGGDVGGIVELSPASTHGPFAEAALELTCGVVEREWIGRVGEGGGGERGENARGKEGEEGEEPTITVVGSPQHWFAKRVPSKSPLALPPPPPSSLLPPLWFPAKVHSHNRGSTPHFGGAAAVSFASARPAGPRRRAAAAGRSAVESGVVFRPSPSKGGGAGGVGLPGGRRHHAAVPGIGGVGGADGMRARVLWGARETGMFCRRPVSGDDRPWVPRQGKLAPGCVRRMLLGTAAPVATAILNCYELIANPKSFFVQTFM